MADLPILFSAPMVRALLDGRKTQTRRILTPQPIVHPAGNWSCEGRHGGFVGAAGTHLDDGFPETARDWMRIQPGDRLWVREAWARSDQHEWLMAYRADGTCGAWQWDGDGRPLFNVHDGKVLDPKRGDHDGHWGLGKFGNRWRSPIHLPRKFSRLTLTVTDVRMQRLQDISEEDAIAEGIVCENVIVGMACYGGPPCEITADRYFFDGCDDEGFEDAVSAYAALWDQINGAGSWDANPWVAAYTFTVARQNIDAGGSA